jgi:ABC-type lipoprotein release transport system permease subunit
LTFSIMRSEMTRLGLLRRNLVFHRRGNLAVLLGVAVGTAVLTGALLVGDSLRGSLRKRAEFQRAGVAFAWTGRFIHEPALENVTPLILSHGTIRKADEGGPGLRVTIFGVDPGFWSFERGWIEPRSLFAMTPRVGIAPLNGEFWESAQNAIALSPSVAQRLNVAKGEAVILDWQKDSDVARESPLGRREVRELIGESPSLQVAEIVRGDNPASAFSLIPGSASPMNVFVPLRTLQELLKQPGRINAVFTRQGERSALQTELARSLTLDDWGVNVIKRANYISVESKQTILEPALATGVERAASGLQSAPTLVYLANLIAIEGKEAIPYSVIAALDASAAPPLGPFLPPGITTLKDDEIVLADWSDSPLRGAQPGTPVTVTYFDPELKEGNITERSAMFRLSGFVPMTGTANDPILAPEFPGITDKLSLRDWDPPFPYVNTRMKPRDEKYWREHKTTPKAYVTLKKGQELWGSRFGNLTSVRLAGVTDIEAFKKRLLTQLNPEQGGFVFDDVEARFEAASQGGQDFGGLFLGFSFFLIASALLLVGLLTRLNVERRASEIGVLLATGWRTRSVRSLLLLEGLIIAALGGFLGLAGAILYAYAMLELLAVLWPDATVGSFLTLHVTAATLATGYIATLVISLAAIYWALRMLRRISASALITGDATQPAPVAGRHRAWVIAATALCFLAGIGLLVTGAGQANPELRAMTFFGGGALLLTAALALIWRWLKGEGTGRMWQGPAALARLGASNARRYPSRSLLTAGLLASAAFLLVAVESFRRHPEKDFSRRDGGSGGFSLLIETDLPVFRAPNGDGRNDLLDAIDVDAQRRAKDKDGSAVEVRQGKARNLLQATRIYPFRLRAGDDASCLNLYQAGRPRLLGVPPSFANEEPRFRIVESEARTPEEKANPWRLLFQTREDGATPVFGEQNTLTWMLKKGLGDEYEVPDDTGRLVRLRIVGVLIDSVFPSELLMGAPDFQKLYPRQQGFTYFLAETPPDQTAAVGDLLRTGFAKYGPEVTLTRDRVAAYLAVENTYLTTFQLLGGLGLLLGAFGLAVVLLRGVWERRGELASLRALGYRNRALGELVMAENGLLLLLGLSAGVGAALLSVLPHLAAGNSVPWLRLVVLLVLVVLAGLVAGLWAVRATLRAPLLPALRKE